METKLLYSIKQNATGKDASKANQVSTDLIPVKGSLEDFIFGATTKGWPWAVAQYEDNHRKTENFIQSNVFFPREKEKCAG